MRVVIQLERIGDLAQTVPALAALARAGQTALLVQEALAPWARCLMPRGVELHTVSGSALQRLVGAARRDARGEEAASIARGIVTRTGLRRATHVVNLTWHATGACLAAAFDGVPVTGPVHRDARSEGGSGFWGLYPRAAVDARPGGRVHMTDVRRLLAEEALGGAAECTARAAGSRAGPIAVVVSASEPRRIWPADRMADLAGRLAALGPPVVLLGGPLDVDRADAISRAARGAARSLAGRLDPPALLGLLGECSLVIGADTGPTHLAVLRDTPCVMMMTGNAHVWETGPTRHGDIALQALPVGTGAAESLTAETVFEAALAALGRRQRPPAAANRFSSHRAFVSREEDGLGGVVYDGEAGTSRATRAILAALAGVPGRLPDGAALAALYAGRSCPQELVAALGGAAVLAERGAGLAAVTRPGDLANTSPADVVRLRRAGQTLSGLASRMLGHPDPRVAGVMIQLLADEVSAGAAPRALERLQALLGSAPPGSPRWPDHSPPVPRGGRGSSTDGPLRPAGARPIYVERVGARVSLRALRRRGARASGARLALDEPIAVHPSRHRAGGSRGAASRCGRCHHLRGTHDVSRPRAP